MLKVSNLYKYYGDTLALNNVSFEANNNEILTIIGDSGSGKSTLLRTLNFIEDKKDGIITLDDVCCTKPTDKIRLNFGLVFQNFNLFPQYSVRNNLLLPLKSKIRREIKEDNIKFFDRKKEFNKRFNFESKNLDMIIDKLNIRKLLDKHVSELSGGEKQRVAICRALSVNPKVLCLDEPTSALDPKLVNEVCDLILSLKELNKIIIVVTHDIALCKKISDKVIFMRNGTIIEYGNRNILENPKTKDLIEFLS